MKASSRLLSLVCLAALLSTPLAAADRAKVVRAAPGDVAASEPGPDPESASVAATLKLRTVKQVKSPSGTLVVTPVSGTPNPLELAGTGLLHVDVNLGAVQARVGASCAPGSSISAIAADGSVTCEPDDIGASFTTGPGLSLAGGVLAPDFGVLQSRVGGTCAPGSSIRSIDGNGVVTCETDDDTNTTYSAGSGLSLVGTTFSANTGSVQSRVTGACPPGSAVTSINEDGSVNCDSMPGRIIDVLLANATDPDGQIGYFNMITNYVPPVDVRAYVFARCSMDGSAAGTIWYFRNAIRSPSGGSVFIGSSYYLSTTTAGANIFSFNTNNDFFDLAAGSSYDFGVNFAATTPTGGSFDDLCSMMVQIVTR